MEHQMLLEAYLKRLKLPAMLTHYQEMARQAEQGSQTYEGYLMALSRLETHQRDENACKRRVSQARFPLLKTLDRFNFSAIPTLNKASVLHLAQGEYIEKKENLPLMGNSGTGKTLPAKALGLTTCQQGKNVRFFTAVGLINLLTEVQAGLRLSQVQRELGKLDLLIIDEIGYVPFSERGSALFFQVVAVSYERQSIILATNLDFSKWSQVFHSEQLTRALLDRFTHHSHILTMNGESYQFKQSMSRKKKQ